MERTFHRDTDVRCRRRSHASVLRLRAYTTKPPILSVIDARRAAIVLLKRCGEVAIAVAVLRAQEAQSSRRYEEMASWYRIAEAAFEYTNVANGQNATMLA